MPSFDPNRKDFTPYGFTCVLWKPTLMDRPDRHNEIEFNLLNQGHLTYILGGKLIQIPNQDLVVFWAGTPHQIIRYENISEYFVLTIPMVWFLQLKLPASLMEPLLQGQIIMEPNGDQFEGDQKRFQTWLRDLDDPSDENQHICLLEIEARLRRMATNFSHPKYDSNLHKRIKSRNGQGDTHLVEQMIQYISLHYTEPITIREISENVGLHPNYAMTLFKKNFGTTIVEYIIQSRLSHSQRLLISTDDLILNIALNSGFGSLSRFNEAFKKAFQCTPRHYRQKHRIGE